MKFKIVMLIFVLVTGVTVQAQELAEKKENTKVPTPVLKWINDLCVNVQNGEVIEFRGAVDALSTCPKLNNHDKAKAAYGKYDRERVRRILDLDKSGIRVDGTPKESIESFAILGYTLDKIVDVKQADDSCKTSVHLRGATGLSQIIEFSHKDIKGVGGQRERYNECIKNAVRK